MDIKLENIGTTLVVKIEGEIDHHTAGKIRDEIDAAIEFHRPACLVIDFGGVSFMDSTGIGFLIGRYKKFKSFGVPVYLTNPSQSTDKILSMSGVYTLMPRV